MPSSYGYVYPAIGICKVLQQQGNQVLLFTGPEFEDVLEKEGVPFASNKYNAETCFHLGMWFKVHQMEKQVELITGLVKEFSPDVLVCSIMNMAPYVVAEQQERPLAVMGFATNLFPYTDETLYKSILNESESRQKFRFKTWLNIYNAIRTASKMPKLPGNSIRPFWGDLFLLRTIPKFEGDIVGPPPQVKFVGDLLWEPDEKDEELEEWLEKSGEGPIIYANHGRCFDRSTFIPLLREKYKDTEVRVVLDVSRMDREEEVLENFFMKKHVPLGKVLPAASALVASGMSTPVLGAITHGVPLLSCPLGSGTDDLAEKCEALGFALQIDLLEKGQEEFDNILDKLINDSSFRENAGIIQEEFKKIDGFAKSAEYISQLAG